MKSNNTKSTAQTENATGDLQKSMNTASRFPDRFGIVKLLNESALLVDNTTLPKCGKAIELVSKDFCQ